MNPFSKNERFRLTDVQSSAQMGEETVILNHDAGVYFSLDEVGTVVWSALQDSSRTFEELVDILVANFDVSVASCTADLEELLTEFIHEKLVEVHP